MKKYLIFTQQKGYNKEKTIELIEDLNRQYLEEVAKGKVTDVGFYAFAKTFVSASEKLIGQKTSDGREIKAISFHLVERLFGDKKTHLLANLSDVVDTIKTGKVSRIGIKRRIFFTRKVIILFLLTTRSKVLYKQLINLKEVKNDYNR